MVEAFVHNMNDNKIVYSMQLTYHRHPGIRSFNMPIFHGLCGIS